MLQKNESVPMSLDAFSSIYL